VTSTWIVFALVDYNPNSFPDSGAVKQFLDGAPLDLRNKKLIAIAYNSPYHLDSTEVAKLTAYFGVYSKTDDAIDVSVQALFRDIEPNGRSPVSVSGVGYDLTYAVQPDASLPVPLTAGPATADGYSFSAGPVLDHNGNRVPNGTAVSFEFAHAGEETETLNAFTTAGTATLSYKPHRSGEYVVTARAGAAASNPLTVTMEGEPESGAPATDAAGPSPASSRGFPTVLALAIGLPIAGVGLAGALAVAFGVRRSRRATPAAPVPEPAPAQPPSLRVDLDTHRVYVEGHELVPPLSGEQFRLLSYLFRNGGKVCTRDELVAHVWPGAHIVGVSEEALDALVRRVRERLAAAGGTRRYIVTLRGQGFRLDL